MKNQVLWRPTKFVMTRRGLRASSDPLEVNTGSRLTADIQAAAYEKVIRSHSRGALLDLGCGKVPLYDVYKDCVTSITCVDYENSRHDTGHVDLYCDLGRELPFDDLQFDTLLVTDVVEHLRNPQLLWSEMYRVLKCGGKIIVGTPFLYWIHEEPHDYARYTRHSLCRFCRDVKFEIISLEPYGGALEVVLDILAKHMAWNYLSGLIHYHVSRLVFRSQPFRWLSTRSIDRFPLGYILVAQK